jgi:hypothetical protein
MSRVSLEISLYITWENQVFIVDVMIIDLIRKIMFLNVINQPTNVIVKPNTILNICK